MGKKPNPTITEEWLSVAGRDLDFAKASLDHSPQFLPQICFYFQQSAEKYFKAYIVSKKLPFKKVHSLPTLVKTCQKSDESFGILLRDCKYLTEFYFEERYPSAQIPSELTLEIAKKAKAAAEKIRNFVLSKLNL